MRIDSKVYGMSVRAPRMTKAAAFFLATALAIPVFIGLSVIDWLWF